jgi:hypothetical protein
MRPNAARNPDHAAESAFSLASQRVCVRFSGLPASNGSGGDGNVGHALGAVRAGEGQPEFKNEYTGAHGR